ncbi:MAG: HAD family hydrolase [Candidatus Altiarchaeota archaeon]
MFKAVLFDMDGTIVDSVPAWHKTFNMVLKHAGREEISYEYFCEDVLGQSTEYDIKRFFPMYTPEQLLGFYDRFFPENISEVKLFPESIEVIEYLKSRGLKVGIVTNTPRDLMFLTLEQVGLHDRFDVVLGGNDVSVGKPGPDIILKACEILGVGVGDALMVGDTTADTGAGRNAGCKTVGIGVDGDWRVESLGEFIGIAKKLIKK